MVEWMIFVAVVLTIAIVQIVKLFWKSAKGRKLGCGDLWVDGGVVSAHSGAVAALALGIYLTEGFSNLFFACLVFAVIVVRDAIGVRKVVKENAKILNRKFKLKRDVSEGHSLMEVVRGIVVGLIVAFLVVGL